MKEFKLLEDLVKFNTINDKENNKIVDYLSKILKDKGFKVEVLTNKDNKACLIAKSKEKCKLCFLGHSDTVTYNEGWHTDPFVLTKRGKELYGLGACDMKGGIAAFIDSLDQIDIAKLSYGIMVIITYDEEIGFAGINLIKDRKDIPKDIIICEPTDLEPIAFCKGCMEYHVTLKGKSVHSSMMIHGDNAVLKAMEFTKDLNKLFKRLKRDKNKKYSIPFTTMNIASIKGGDSINIVPSKCELTFDFRTILESHHKLIRKEVDSLCKKYDAIYETITDVLPSNNKSVTNLELIEKLTGKKTTGANYVTEGNFLTNKNIIIVGPGPVTAHEVDEHISIESYNKTKEVYKNIVNYLCK